MKFKILLEVSEDGGFTAIVPSLPGCISEGDTKTEALKNIQEANEVGDDESDKFKSGLDTS